MWYFRSPSRESPSASMTPSPKQDAPPSAQPLDVLQQHLALRELRELHGSPGPLGTAQAVTPATQQRELSSPPPTAARLPTSGAITSVYTPFTAERSGGHDGGTPPNSPEWLAAYTAHLEELAIAPPEMFSRTAVVAVPSEKEGASAVAPTAVGKAAKTPSPSPKTRENGRRAGTRRAVLSLTPKSIAKHAESLFDGLFGNAATPPAPAASPVPAAAQEKNPSRREQGGHARGGFVVFADSTNRLDNLTPPNGTLGGRPRLQKKAKRKAAPKFDDWGLFDKENIPPPARGPLATRGNMNRRLPTTSYYTPGHVIV